MVATQVENFQPDVLYVQEYWTGRFDVLAIAEWIQGVRPNDALWLAGFSFGSYVAARAAPQLPVRQMISVAPPVSRWDFTSLASPN